MQKRVLLHISFWLAYVLFKTSLNLSTASASALQQFDFEKCWILLQAQLALLLIKVPMVYTLFFITEKYFSKQWKISKTVFSVALLYIISLWAFLLVVHFIVSDRIYNLNNSFSEHLNIYSFIYNSFLLLFTCSIAIAVKLVRLTLRQKETEKEIIKKKLETELQFLKAQTNPHFLFNTLNNIYALARKKSDATADVVMKLSKLLRFMLYESQKQTIRIADEIQVLDDYIELERIRYSERLQIDFTKAVDDELHPVAPLILLPFVENAFKHGISENRFNSYIRINLQLKDEQLSFSCENSKAEETTKSEAETIGLGNIKRQLELLYPNHLLEIKNEKSYFTVLLKINLADYATV